jgi:acyl carrier protein
MSTGVLAKVREIFNELFDVDPQSVSLETKAVDITGWDSVGHLSLCGALEDAFDVRFDVGELAEMNSVRTIVSIIDTKKGLPAET